VYIYNVQASFGENFSPRVPTPHFLAALELKRREDVDYPLILSRNSEFPHMSKGR
jgi:hypothetical protein